MGLDGFVPLVDYIRAGEIMAKRLLELERENENLRAEIERLTERLSKLFGKNKEGQ